MIDEKIVNSLRGLSIDMIDKACSGHPGVCLGASPIIYTLYSKHMKIDLNNSNYINRDRFVLSGGHASALLYSMLYYLGYLSMDDLKNFRHINSKTPGHPEIYTSGVDVSTGPLGQGISNAVGIAIGEKYLETILNKKIDYYTYVMCGDGDLEEGISYEALSLAGTLNLNKLIILYDSNDISLDGKTNITFNDNIKMRFESINFNYIITNDSVVEIDNAINKAKMSDKPTIIEVKTTIGKYSEKEGTNKVHGSPLDKHDIALIKEKLNLSIEPFTIDENLVNEFRNNIKERLKNIDFSDFRFNLKFDLNNIPEFYKDMNESLRDTSKKILNIVGEQTPLIIGGSADLSSSTKTYLDDKGVFSKENYSGRNIFYGVREHAMAGISNGIALTGLYPFLSTFMVFSDYMKPSIRMSALMNLPVTYIFTHDNITVGQDGATHEAIEQIGMLRSIPNFTVYKPADANEIVGSYINIFKENKPCALVLSRNSSPLLDGSKRDVSQGGYIIHKEKNRLDAVIISSGTEVNDAVKISLELEKLGKNIRVVSMPSVNLFERQSNEYKLSIVPKGYKTFVIEYSNDNYWYKYTDEKYILNINSFGKSGTKEEVLKEFNLDYESMLEYIKNNL